MSSETVPTAALSFVATRDLQWGHPRSDAHAVETISIVESFLPLITASIAAHFLVVGILGSGVVTTPSKPIRQPQPRPPASIIEEVKLESAPLPLPVAKLAPEPRPAPPSAPTDTPLPELRPIAAVSSKIHVAFASPVDGPVRLVSDAASASAGAAGRRSLPQPVALDAENRRQLLLPPISYPALAKRRHLTGTVVVEFKTSPTGEIFDARVNQSSGAEALDRAALENLRAGRWSGAPGFYAKAYEFNLN